MRASGESYSGIAKKLKISKGTCSEWVKKYEAEIKERRAEKLEELYALYAMDKEKRIERLGTALQSIEKAVKAKNLEELPADALLKLQLKYEEALRSEYSEPGSEELPEEKIDLDDIIKALSILYKKQESGAVTPAQAKAQLATIQALLMAYTRKEAEW